MKYMRFHFVYNSTPLIKTYFGVIEGVLLNAYTILLHRQENVKHLFQNVTDLLKSVRSWTY